MHTLPFTCFAHTAPTVRQYASTKPPAIILPPPTSAYIHLPFCRKRCHYCDFTIIAIGAASTQAKDNPRMTNYVHILCLEINATKARKQDRPASGNGVFWQWHATYCAGKARGFRFGDIEVEIWVEFRGSGVDGDGPGTFYAKKMKGLMELGVNRVSLGVQAFQEELLKACGRAHGVREVYEAMEIVGECGVENWGMDLISSLPHQTPEMWEESLRLTVEACLTHVSVYDLIVEQGTKFRLL